MHTTNELDRALTELMAYDGVEHLLLLGDDGLLVRHIGRTSDIEAETVAAMAPGVVSACSALGAAAKHGEFATAVVDVTDGVVILSSLPNDLFLAALVRPNVGFAPLLRDVRRERERLASLL